MHYQCNVNQINDRSSFNIHTLISCAVDPSLTQTFTYNCCPAGGVLLATSFLHMLPEVRESFEKTTASAAAADATTNASSNDTSLKVSM